MELASLTTIESLKESLRTLAPTAVPVTGVEPQRLPTGDARLDRLLAGGLPQGAITELTGDVSSGKTSIALAMAAARTREGELVAYLDARAELYPPAAAAVGVDLSHFLVVRFARPRTRDLDLARAADILIRSKQISLIIIDLGDALSPQRSARLRQNLHATRTSILVLGERAGAVTGAALRLQAWSHRSEFGAKRSVEIHVHKGAPRLGERAALDLARLRVDHAPARAIAEPCLRVAPGTPPPKPPRAQRQRPLSQSGASEPRSSQPTRSKPRRSHKWTTPAQLVMEAL